MTQMIAWPVYCYLYIVEYSPLQQVSILPLLHGEQKVIFCEKIVMSQFLPSRTDNCVICKYRMHLIKPYVLSALLCVVLVSTTCYNKPFVMDALSTSWIIDYMCNICWSCAMYIYIMFSLWPCVMYTTKVWCNCGPVTCILPVYFVIVKSLYIQV